ncbi:MAG: flagellar export protein FliJ [Termitinemataceae bacterium]
MKRFRFDLEKLLELRAYYEREAELELAKAMAELQGIQQRLEKLAEDRASVARDRFLRSRSVAELQTIDLYLLRLDKTKEQLLEAAAKAELLVEEKRTVFLEASKDRKVIEKLKEKRLQDYRAISMAEETKEIDDISGGRQARQNLSI